MTDGRIRLLLVEDDEDDYLLMRDALAEIEGMEFALDWVATGEAAREAIDRGEHDVYLVDYHLGADSGLDLVREIAASGGPAPIILVTGHGDRRVDIAAMEAGATDYLVKGELTPAVLERSVRYAQRHARAQTALRESEERFRSFIEAMPVGAVLTGPQGQILMSNQATEQILGLSEEQLAGRATLDPAWDVRAEDGTSIPPDALPPFTVLRTGEAVRDLVLGIDRPLRGGRVWVQGSALPRYARDGSLLGVISTFTDITRQRRAEDALRVSEARFRSLYEHAPIGMALLEMEGQILLVNPALQRILGYDEAALCRMTFADVTHPVDVAADWALFREVLEGTRDTYTIDKRCVRQDGQVMWGHWAVSATRDRGGAPQSIIGMLLDITERHKAALSLEMTKVAAEELAQFRKERADEATAMNTVSEALASTLEPAQLYQVILEQAARILPCDYAAVTVYAGGRATIIATWGEPRLDPGSTWPMADLWLPDARSAVSYQPDTDADPRWNALPPLVGPYRERSVLSAPLLIDGTLVGSFNVSSRSPDFYSERHHRLAALFANRATDALRNAQLFEAEQQRRRAAEDLADLRSDFVSAVSHELRTPLTAIIGFGELLLAYWDRFSEQSRLQRIAQIVQAANRQKRMVEDLLLLSQLEESRLGPARDVLELRPLLQQAIGELQGSYPGQGIDLSGMDHLCIRADAARVVQILVNVLDNAAKYSATGSPIGVSWWQDGELVAVRVRDHGPGIPGEGRLLLFTRFGRVPGSRMRAGHVGTGLGLFLGRQLAEAMGGDLDLESTGPEGSTFRLRLPFAVDSVPDP